VSLMGPQVNGGLSQIAVLPLARATKMEMMSGFKEEGPYWQKAEPRQLMPRARAVGKTSERSTSIMVLRMQKGKV